MIFMTRSQMRSYDEVAMGKYGVPGPVLMENAGRGAATVVLEAARGRAGDIAIVCGRGNNGGDGFVIARHLANAGLEAHAILLGAVKDLRGDAALNAGILAAMKGRITEMADGADRLPTLLRHASVIVDAIFGTGLEREVTGAYRQAIEAINASGAPIVAVDLPSGLDADTGRPLGISVQAHRTATFACLKRGLVVHPGVELAGEVTVVDIGAPARIIDEVGFDGEVLETSSIRPLFAPRRADAHKGTYGHVLAIAGSPGKSGAAIMAAFAALRAGAGLVTVAVPGTLMAAIEAAKPPEVMLEPLLDSLDSPLSGDALSRLDALLEGKSAVVLGPGCGLTEPMQAVLQAVLARAEVPLVIDADGITLLSRLPAAALDERSHPTVLTPHPGEMSRLVGKPPTEIQHERIPVAREYARARGTFVVLKGARTVIASPEGSIWINPTGNPGMASGGTGDVLTGMIGGLLAQRHRVEDAVAAGVYLHGLAADRAAEETGRTALVAGDVLTALPDVLSEMES